MFPKEEEWREEIESLIDYMVHEISFVPCFIANEIGNAREGGKVKIFEGENDQYINQKKEEV